MSNEVAIRVENLGKRYRIGVRQPYKTLRDVLSAPFRQQSRPQTTDHRPQTTDRRRKVSGLQSPPDTIWALKDVSFEIRQGEVVGIIGRNGAGKSTLLKILSRITEPTEGYADIYGRVGSLLEVGTGFHPELTGRENIFLNGAILGMKRAEIASKFDEIVAFAEVEKFIDTPVKHYSSGMYVRLAFAVAAHLEPEILLVDEVLAVGDAAFQKKCLGKMGDVARQGRTVLLVSHNMAAVRAISESSILFEDGRVKAVGRSDEVIRIYLASSAVAPVGGADLAARQDRAGTGRVRAVSFLARHAADQLISPRSGGSAEFVVGYTAAAGKPVKKLFVAVGICDSLGAGLFTCSTSMRNCDFVDLPATGSVRCHLDYLPLAPGRYTVNLKLMDGEGTTDLITNAAAFDVVEGGESGFVRYPGQTWGTVIVPHHWVQEDHLVESP